MCSVEKFMGGSCFGGLRLLGDGHLDGSSYTRCCLPLTCSESHRSRSNKLGLPWLSCFWTSIAHLDCKGPGSFWTAMFRFVSLKRSANESLSVKGDDSWRQCLLQLRKTSMILRAWWWCVLKSSNGCTHNLSRVSESCFEHSKSQYVICTIFSKELDFWLCGTSYSVLKIR